MRTYSLQIAGHVALPHRPGFSFTICGRPIGVVHTQSKYYIVGCKQLNAEVEEKEEERVKTGCKLTAGSDTKTKKVCETDKWSMY